MRGRRWSEDVTGLTVEIHTRRGGSGDVAVIRCEGELDVATAAKLIDAFDRISAHQPEYVRVDLRGVDFVDSTGVGCLTHGALAFHNEGARFEILPSEAVNDLITKLGLKGLLTPPNAPVAGVGEVPLDPSRS
jgi:anti-anti-sigma factor